MARQNRFFVAGYPQHVIQRGNNRQPVFFSDGDRRFYLDCLRDACARFGCDLHAYVLMTNHVHLLMSPRAEESLPQAMQSLGRRYAQYVNWRRERTGTLWEGRYRAAAVDTDGYFFTCSRYIELNPVRAGMARRPGDYRWSSYVANAQGTGDPLVTPHPLYRALGDSAEQKAAAYRLMFENDLGGDVLGAIRSATHHGWPLGGPAFCAKVEEFCGRRARPLPKGGVRRGARRRSENQALESIVSDPIDQNLINRL